MLGLVGCGKYSSRAQAEAECEKWAKEGGSYQYEVQKEPPSWNYNERGEASPYNSYEVQWVWIEADVRACNLEIDTRQYLGYDNGMKNGAQIKSYEREDADIEPKIKKHFRY